jgi:2-phosphosulfolactate phosphatase
MSIIEVYFTPEEYIARHSAHNHTTVVVDILRASTTICTALAKGVKAIIPVAQLEEARAYKKQGYLVASERNSDPLAFADFGNSPLDFLNTKLLGKEIVLSTTNGTKSIAAANNSQKVIIGAFINLSSLAQYLIQNEQNVTILCSGWKGVFNLEDTVFAGALSDLLSQSGNYQQGNDGAVAALALWKSVESDFITKMLLSEAAKRLLSKGLKKEIEYCFKVDQVKVVPVLKNGKIITQTLYPEAMHK